MPQGTPPPPDDPEQGQEHGQERGTSFLSRWSQRKARAAEAEAPPVASAEAEAAEATAPESRFTGDDDIAAEAPPPVTEADLENLTYESDYTKFMGKEVPDALRRRALQTLWRSDPVLANLDGLCDYDDDFTDAALAVKVLQTAHKVGQGYLTDEDLAANRARGEPKPAAVAATADDAEPEEIDEDVSEDMSETEDEVEEAEAEVTDEGEETAGTVDVAKDDSGAGKQG